MEEKYYWRNFSICSKVVFNCQKCLLERSPFSRCSFIGLTLGKFIFLKIQWLFRIVRCNLQMLLLLSFVIKFCSLTKVVLALIQYISLRPQLYLHLIPSVACFITGIVCLVSSLKTNFCFLFIQLKSSHEYFGA